MIVERGPHHRAWSAVQTELDEHGQTVYHTNRYVELQTGVCYKDDQTGQWSDTICEIELHPEGACLRNAQHKIIFSANLNTAGAIDLLTPDGKRLRSTPLGLAYYDPASGKSAWLGGIQDCQGELVPPNQVIYRNAFSNINCVVRYTVTKAGMEQDIILLENPSIKPDDCGFDPEHARLEVVTEFHEFPKPDIKKHIIKKYLQKPGKSPMADSEFLDEDLSFGAMQTYRGKAFKLNNGDEGDPGVEVGKRFGTAGGRSFLIEGVEYQSIRPYLSVLPKSKNKIRTAMSLPVTDGWIFPQASQVRKSKSPLVMAKAGVGQEPGFVIDYQLLGNLSNYTLKGDTTYWVSGPTFLQNTIIEGGAVIKYAKTNDAYLNMTGTLRTDTSMYHPAIFTAEADNSVGEVVTTAPLSGYYGGVGMWLYTGNTDLKYLNFRYLKFGLSCFRNSTYNFSHLQFVNIDTAIQQHGTTNAYRNVLFDHVLAALNFTLFTNAASFEHATFSGGSYVAYGNPGTLNTLTMTNSLIVQVANTNAQPFTAVNCAISDAASAVFQTAGAGGYYLKDSAFRHQGTTNLSAATLQIIRAGTTYPPAILANTLLAADTVLSPRVQLDTDAPDLGYHYAPLDYLVSMLAVTNATLTLTNGVAVGVYGSPGIELQSGARFISEGTPLTLNHLVRYQTAQEQPLNLNFSDYMALVHAGQICDIQPQVRMRFTEVTSMADGVNRVNLFRNPYPINPIELTDCQLHSVRVYLYPIYGDDRGISLAVTNCLWDRVFADLAQGVRGDTTPFTMHFRNTTLRGGYCYASLQTNNPAAWSFCDNAFVQSANWFSFTGSTWTNLCNAYYNSAFLPNAVSNLTMPSAPFLSGTLGAFYLATNSVLIDAGSRYATNAGLYHYTTQTNNAREAGSRVDIGFHYVATTNGAPFDADGDGLPDYVEDRNGNGLRDSNETDMNDPDSDYDGRLDGQEIAQGTDPLDPNSVQPARLFYARFNNANFKAEDGQMPLASKNARSVASFDGNGVQIDRTSAAYLTYRDQETNGLLNINVRSGAIRFLFKPNWTSSNSGGTGPGASGHLVSVGRYTSPPTTGWWALTITNNGNTIALVSQTNGSSGAWASGNISFTSNSWYEITLVYNTNASQIFIRQDRVANGPGLAFWPNAAARALNGFAIGSAYNGSQQAKGAFDEFETYNYPLGLDKGNVIPTDWGYPVNMYAESEVDATLSATLLESANAIRAEWRYDPTYHPSLKRRVFGQTNWTLLATNYYAWSFTDTNLTNGVVYEYQLNDRFRNILSGYNLPATEYRGRIILLIDRTYTNEIANNLEVLNRDLIGDGWSVTNYYTARHNDADWPANTNNIHLIKSFVTNEYQLYSNDLKALFIIGHAPIPRTGMMAPDGHFPRPWPVDGYYADALESAAWTDSQTKVGPYITNAPGDGMFDQESYPSPAELMFGRIDYANMNSLTNATEPQLLNDYLVKSHQYRHSLLQFSNRIYALGCFHSGLEPVNTVAYRDAINFAGKRQQGAIPAILEGNTFINGQSAAWMCQSASGSYISIDDTGPNMITTLDMASTQRQYHTRFYLLLGSLFGEWDVPNNFLRAVTAPPESGLGALWAVTDTLWNFRKIGIGGCVGEGILDTVTNRVFPAIHYEISFEWMGDPTLRDQILPPPQNVTAEIDPARTMIYWNYPPDALTSFNVYRSTNGFHGAFTRLNDAPLSNTSFADAPPPAGAAIYMVRALKKIYTDCASYTNLSQGVFIAKP